MTTTAYDDQFSAEPEPDRQQYDVAAILRKNVADLEKDLQRQKERAEKAEGELKAAREQAQEPYAYDCGGDITKNAEYAAWFEKAGHGSFVALYASPLPAPAVPAVTVCHMECDECAKAGKCLYSMQAKPSLIPAPTPFMPDDDTRRNDKAFAAQQAAPVPDCRTCANRGRINGLSQESYCDSCIYQGRDWRQNHFVDAVNRRCEACAILPCSCK